MNFITTMRHDTGHVILSTAVSNNEEMAVDINQALDNALLLENQGDYSKAYDAYKPLADNGVPTAMWRCAQMLFEGRPGVSQDKKQAITLLNQIYSDLRGLSYEEMCKVVDQCVPALEYLALLQADGEAEYDTKDAFEGLLEMRQLSENPRIPFELAKSYLNTPVSFNKQKVIALLERAVELGSVEAAHKLHEIYVSDEANHIEKNAEKSKTL